MGKIKEIILEPANVKTGSNFKLKIKTANETQHKGTNLTFNNSKANQATIRPEGHSEQDTYTGKNLINVTGFSKEENGITFTNNNDGTILVNGTATAQANFYVNTAFNVELNQSYALSGCPTNGSINSYALWSNDDGIAQDNGSGVIFTPTTTNQTRISLRIRIQSGTVCNNLLFKPMLESGTSVTSWEPYVR